MTALAILAIITPPILGYGLFHWIAHQTRANGRAGYVATLAVLSGWLAAGLILP